jgi:dethiobiotin synthetase
MKTRVLFVTGTGTGVGKTFVSGLLLRRLRAEGRNACTMKPIQTGPQSDLMAHWQIANWRPSAEHAKWMSTYALTRAASPHLAARLEGITIETSRIVEDLHRLSSEYDTIIIEGAGGVLVPVSQTETMRELLITLDVPVVVVGALGLGTINHTLLTLEVLATSHIPCSGVVLNEAMAEQDPMVAQDNPQIIEYLSGAPILATLRHVKMDEARKAADAWDIEKFFQARELGHDHHHDHHH